LLSRLLRLFRVEGGEREGNNLWARDLIQVHDEMELDSLPSWNGRVK
jgi:hypothetical protein